DRKLREIAALSGRILRAQLLELTLQTAIAFNQLTHFFRCVTPRALHERQDGIQLRVGLVHPCNGSRTRNCFDTASTRCDAGFADDSQQSDVTCATDVRPAAKLYRIAIPHRQHANAVAVLLAEERHRPAPERFDEAERRRLARSG